MVRIIFFGTSYFSIPVLESLIRNGYEVLAVVTTPDKPTGRKQILTSPPIKSYLLEHEAWGIRIFQPGKLDSSFKREILSLEPDLFIIAAYGKIIPLEILEMTRYDSINIHPSLLPRWRGPSPIQAAIISGDEKTGVTIHITREKVDAGEILIKKDTVIEPNDTCLSLEKKLAELGAKLLLEILPKYIQGEITPIPQDESEVTYSKIITTEDGRIDWSRSAREISLKIRALNPEPGTFCYWNNKRFIILEGKVEDILHDLKPGTVIKNEEGFKIAAGEGFLKPDKIKLEGKKETSPSSFLRGYPSIIGATLT